MAADHQKKAEKVVARMPMSERLAYRIDEAADTLGVSRRTIYNLIARGELSPRKIGRSTVIPRDQLNTLLTPPAAA